MYGNIRQNLFNQQIVTGTLKNKDRTVDIIVSDRMNL